MLVAALALTAALATTAIAAPDTLNRALSKSKVKKIAKKQINKRLPVQSEDIADQAVDAAKVADGSLGTAEFSKSIPVVRATRNTDQSIPFQSNSATTLAFDAERYDTAAMHDNAANNSRLTAPVSGIYAISAQVSLNHSSPGTFRVLTVIRNDAASIARVTADASTTGTQSLEANTQVLLQAGDYIEAALFHDAGGLVAEKLGEVSPEFSMAWVAPGP